jgi:hypothetical protein
MMIITIIIVGLSVQMRRLAALISAYGAEDMTLRRLGPHWPGISCGEKDCACGE